MIPEASGAIKALYDLASRFVEGREKRRQREHLLRLRGALRGAQQGHPAPLVFTEDNLQTFARHNGIPTEDVPGLLYDLEREGFLAPFFVGYTLVERWRAPGRPVCG